MSEPLFLRDDGTPYYSGSIPYDQNGQNIYFDEYVPQFTEKERKEIDARHKVLVENTKSASTNNSAPHQFTYESIVKRLFGSTTKK